jgi:hypothetical protein
MGKHYTTERQRALLKSVGVGHRRGRTYEEAEELIGECIRQGKLPRNAFSPATEGQRAFLRRYGIQLPADATREEASELIVAKGRVLPLTERQHELIEELGGKAPSDMTQDEASQFIEYLMPLRVLCRRCGASFDRRKPRCFGCGAFVPRLAAISVPRSIYVRKGPCKRLLESLRAWIGGNAGDG